MKHLVLLTGAVALLSACSSHNQPVMSQFKPQYCYQTTTINTTDGNTVNSKGITECSDNPKNKHFLAYSEIAKDCREYWYDIWLNGKAVAQRGYVCQKINGEWEIVSHPYN
tara:strand:+ start:892 stop:1224 length:333 start_codon:yes stop_codon:yes gene_type:complete